MVAITVLSTSPETIQEDESIPENLQKSPVISLEEFMLHPPDRMEWVDGEIVEKTGATFKHGLAQAKMSYYWRNYMLSSGQEGEVLIGTLGRTAKHIRRPDVAYLTPELLQQVGNFTVLTQSFPLIAEVASPDDSAEELFAKTKEYLESGCQEVWLLFPEERIVMIKTAQRWILFNKDEVVSTQVVLTGFSVRSS